MAGRDFFSNKSGKTGTVPKVKHRNNSSQSHLENNHLSNNLVEGDYHSFDLNYTGHGQRNRQLSSTYHLPRSLTDSTYSDNYPSISRLNGPSSLNMAANPSQNTPSASVTNSRRNSTSTVPKCDNVSRYPDKKQIEDKLEQIREYLRYTSTLMMSIRNGDERLGNDEAETQHLSLMIKDLKDSEAKLVLLLKQVSESDEPSSSAANLEEDNRKVEGNLENPPCNNTNSQMQRKELEQNLEQSNRNLEMLREHQNTLLMLQQKAENQLRDAREAQERLLAASQERMLVQTNSIQSIPEQLNISLNSESTQQQQQHQQPSTSAGKNGPGDRILTTNGDIDGDMDRLREQIAAMHSSSENRQQLLHLLDNRDAQLSSEHIALQGKLHELQNKKSYIDQLVSQLQHMNDDSHEEGNDLGVQVRHIVSMKEQLAKLKDMLEVVKATELSMESQNVNDEFQGAEEHAMNVCSNSSKTDNIAQGMVKRRSNERWSGNEKQSNKTSAVESMTRERQQLLQAELQAKKQELEELMYKDQDRTSKINQDVCSEVKSEPAGGSGIFDSVPSSWFMVSPQRNRASSRENVYSSDEAPEEDLDYSQMNFSLPRNFRSSSEASNILRSSDIEPSRNETKPRIEFPRTQSTQYITNLQHTPRSVRSVSIPTPTVQVTNENNTHEQNKIQKQLELITTLCQSMLEQQNTLQHCPNNLSPSPLYSEPRGFNSLNSHPMNAVNVVNPGPTADMPWLAPSIPQPCFPGQAIVENGAYPNLLIANTLQTQALMLSTLNQCCQMLWHQQREMSALRNTIQMMQDRLPNYESNLHTLSPYSNMTNYLNPPIVTLSNTPSNQHSQARSVNQPKMNPQQVSTSAAQFPVSHNMNDSQTTNSDSGFCFSSGTNLNNSNLVLNHQNTTGDSVLHLGTNPNNTNVFDNGQSNINRTLPTQSVWGGTPALNNQVPPGNRANNYWDNFRSYSRQNLLSTSAKRNEMPQNAQHSAGLAQSGPKLNTMHHDTQEASATSSRRSHNEHPTNRNAVSETASANPNHSTNKTNENVENPVLSLHSFNQLINSQNDTEDNMSMNGNEAGSNSIDDPNYKMQSSSRRNRNEWHNDEIPTDTVPTKSKLFEVLREPIYKEVASLISANVNRPHFLIQLFRDLQMISSDPLRNSTLQSIQSVIANSLSSTPEGNTSQGASSSRQNPNFHQLNEQEFLPNPNAESISNNENPDNLFPSTSEAINSGNSESDFHLSVNVQQILVQVLSFLKSHKDDIFQISIIDDIKAIILKLVPGVDILCNANLKQYTGFIINQLDKMLTETLVKHQGKRVHEIKEEVLKEMADILLGELTFLKLISSIDHSNIGEALKTREINQTLPENSLQVPNEASLNGAFNLQIPLVNHSASVEETAIANEVINGDLAEADQSQVENEEGAVGGVFLPPSSTDNTTENVVGTDELDLPKIDFPVNNTESENELAEQGLDQVPTRLIKRGGRSLRSASHSPTKRRDRSQSHSDTPDHF